MSSARHRLSGLQSCPEHHYCEQQVRCVPPHTDANMPTRLCFCTAYRFHLPCQHSVPMWCSAHTVQEPHELEDLTEWMATSTASSSHPTAQDGLQMHWTVTHWLPEIQDPQGCGHQAGYVGIHRKAGYPQGTYNAITLLLFSHNFQIMGNFSKSL